MRTLTAASGFTLIESLVACTLLATALLSVGYLSSSVMTGLADARRRTVATVLALAKLEELHASHAPMDGADTVDSRGQPPSTDTPGRYDRRWSVTRVSAGVAVLSIAVTPLPAGVRGREVRITGGWTAPRP